MQISYPGCPDAATFRTMQMDASESKSWLLCDIQKSADRESTEE
jgi:hypothetical protein